MIERKSEKHEYMWQHKAEDNRNREFITKKTQNQETNGKNQPQKQTRTTGDLEDCFVAVPQRRSIHLSVHLIGSQTGKINSCYSARVRARAVC